MASKTTKIKKKTSFKGEIQPGFDFLHTVVAQQLVTFPADLFGGNKKFEEMVTFVGAPLNPPHGNADTVYQRLAPARIGEPVESRLVAFVNVSAAPIRIVDGKGRANYFDLYVTLSPTAPSETRSVFSAEDSLGGTFESEVSLTPLFELRPLGGKARSLFIDTGKTPLPGFPMRLGTFGGKWSVKPEDDLAVRSFGGQSLFYRDEIMITAIGPGGVSQAACAKRQASFASPEGAGLFDRIDFGMAKPDANLELFRWTDKP